MRRLLRLAAFAIAAGLPAGAAETGFALTVTLSPKAEARMAALREGIVVSASYYGEAGPGAEAEVDEVGRIDLGREMFTLPDGALHARVGGRGFRADRLRWVAGPPMVNVNLFSARRAGPDNILDCDFIDTEVARLQAEPVHLRCFLIGEGGATRQRP